MENFALLRDPASGVKVALIQDGSVAKDEAAEFDDGQPKEVKVLPTAMLSAMTTKPM